MSETIKMNVECPNCQQNLLIQQDLNELKKAFTPKDLAPTLRGDLVPSDSIFEYRISSEEIKKFIIDKAHEYVPEAKLQIVPRYTERKKRDEREPHRSYASFFIGFSSDVIQNNNDYGWYGKIGESFENVIIVQELWEKFIKRYQYDPEMINSWMKSYKKMEKLEEGLGITEQFLAELKHYKRPLGIRTNHQGEVWVFFMAAPEMILNDMFVEVGTDKPAGRIEVRDIVSVSKDIIEYRIHLHPNDVVTTVNPHVIQILNGEDKKK